MPYVVVLALSGAACGLVVSAMFGASVAGSIAIVIAAALIGAALMFLIG